MTETAAAPIYYFQEEQHFSRLWLLVCLPILTPILLVLFLGNSIVAVVIGTIGTTVMTLPALLLYTMKLVIKVDSDYLHIKFPPFSALISRSHIPLSEIAHWQARTYSPILEYGGWGLRRGIRGKGRAYNVRGNQGVQLQLTDGTKLLIGSQRAQELADAITLAKSHN
jgi:hypothetical protein